MAYVVVPLAGRTDTLLPWRGQGLAHFADAVAPANLATRIPLDRSLGARCVYRW